MAPGVGVLTRSYFSDVGLRVELFLAELFSLMNYI